jgi:hypothetical protein
MSYGDPISYMVLAVGTEVRAADGAGVGVVVEVLAAVEQDIFEGLIVRSAHGERFVDGDLIEAIYERCVVLTVSAEQAAALPPPRTGGTVFRVNPGDPEGWRAP